MKPDRKLCECQAGGRTNCVHFHVDAKLLRKQLSESRLADRGIKRDLTPLWPSCNSMRPTRALCDVCFQQSACARAVCAQFSLETQTRNHGALKSFTPGAYAFEIPALALMGHITELWSSRSPRGALRRFTL
jgi:hypothetical protein